MSEKVTGYLLLAIGLLLIVATALHIFMVFTKRAEPFALYSIDSSQEQSAPAKPKTPTSSLPDISQLGLPNLDILPKAELNRSLNLVSDFFLMSFLAGVGYKLASLGVMLLRPIYVKLKAKEVESVTT